MDAEVLRECYRISWEVADRLRAFDEIEHLDELVAVLFSFGIATSNERANRLTALTDLYGKLVNPEFSGKMREVGEANVIAFGNGQDPKIYAPGLVPPLEVTIAGLHAADNDAEANG